MQTIWTRAAQLGSACRCPQCASSIQGISRRTSASANRRMPRYLTTSTLLYSGIFAAATTYDAKFKRERREQWDQAIADIREELDEPHGGRSQATQQSEVISKDKSRLPDFGSTSQLIEFGSYLDSTVLRRQCHWAPESTAGQVEGKRMAPQSLYAARSRKLEYLGRPWGELKLERVRLCMDKLQLDIMEELHKARLSKDATKHVPTSYGQHIMSTPSDRRHQCNLKLGDIARLREQDDPELRDWRRSEEDLPLNEYHMDEAGHFVESTRILNQRLQILFRRRARGRISRAELLAKVSYNISACPTPPSVDTFNALIVGFAHLKEKHLYNCTTVALYYTRVRPNEVTLASIFKYDTEAQDYAHFHTWLRRLRGLDGGLYAARNDIYINEDNRSRLFARPDSRSDAIIQLPSPTPMVFNALVGGILKFFGFDAALRVCRDMGDTGWGLSMAGLQALLEDCAVRRDWKAGISIWDKIQALKAKSRKPYHYVRGSRVPRSVWISEKIQIPTYFSMLKLCRKCSEKETFETIVEEAAKEHQVGLTQLVQMLKEGGRSALNPSAQKTELPRTISDTRSGVQGGVRDAILQDRTPTEVTGREVRMLDSSSSVDLVVHKDQLVGSVPGNRHLDEHEMHERPMST